MLDIIISGRKSRKQKFNPSHAVIEKATTYFLDNGGEITKLEFDENSFANFISSNESPVAVDEFLSGV